MQAESSASYSNRQFNRWFCCVASKRTIECHLYSHTHTHITHRHSIKPNKSFNRITPSETHHKSTLNVVQWCGYGTQQTFTFCFSSIIGRWCASRQLMPVSIDRSAHSCHICPFVVLTFVCWFVRHFPFDVRSAERLCPSECGASVCVVVQLLAGGRPPGWR